MCTMFLIFFLGNDVVYLATSPDMSWQSLVASLNPTACKAAMQYCGLGCRSLNNSGLNKAGANTPLCKSCNLVSHYVNG